MKKRLNADLSPSITGLLHWFTSPYVHHLDFDRQSREGTATTMNILSQTQRHHFRESEVIYPDTMRPQVTFEVSHPQLAMLRFSEHDLKMVCISKLLSAYAATATQASKIIGFIALLPIGL